MTITCGIDWAENHHDVALVDEAGKLVAKRRIGDDVQGYRELLAGAGDSAGEPIPVAVETARGLLISCPRATGRKVYSINPITASSRTCSRRRRPSGVSPPPCAYRMHPAYRRKPHASAPDTAN